MVATEFTWKHAGEKVLVTGTFDDWQSTVELKKQEGSDIFSATVDLKPDTKYLFKFGILFLPFAVESH